MKYTGVLVFFLAITGCSTGKIVSNYTAPDPDFSAYKTYSYPGLNIQGDTLLREYGEKISLINEAIDKEMTARGYTKSTASDLLVNVGIVVEERVQTRETDIREAPRYYGTRTYNWEVQEVKVGTYNVGTLTIDVVDVKANELVWQGIAESVLNEKRSLEKARKIIFSTIEELFNKYPVQPASN